MKKLILMGAVLLLGACSSSEKQVSELLRKNPQILFDVIEEHPEQFIESVNKAARKAQERHQEKQVAELKAQQDDQLKNPLKPEISEERMLMGTKGAKTVIVEYADFQCPACRMAHSNLKDVLTKNKADVQFYFKHMPLNFHNMAMPAAIYYEAVARQSRTKAQEFYDFLFENQTDMKNEAFLESAANKLKVDMKRLKKDIESDDIKKNIEADMAEFEKFAFTGTPVLVVNGVALHGAQPTSEILKTIEMTSSRTK